MRDFVKKYVFCVNFSTFCTILIQSRNDILVMILRFLGFITTFCRSFCRKKVLSVPRIYKRLLLEERLPPLAGGEV